MKNKFNIIWLVILVLLMTGCQEQKRKIPVLKKINPFFYCAIEAQGSWSQYTNKVAMLKDEVLKQKIANNDNVISVWRSYPNKTKEAAYKWEVGFKVPKGTVVVKPLVLKEWKTKELYSQVYEGPADKSAGFFKKYWSWFKNNDLRVVRPLLEIATSKEKIAKGTSKFEVLISAEPK